MHMCLFKKDFLETFFPSMELSFSVKYRIFFLGNMRRNQIFRILLDIVLHAQLLETGLSGIVDPVSKHKTTNQTKAINYLGIFIGTGKSNVHFYFGYQDLCFLLLHSSN